MPQRRGMQATASDDSTAAPACSQVYDASAPEEGAGPANFEVVTEAGGWWEVPLEGAGTPENPVPGPNFCFPTAPCFLACL